MKTLNLSPLDPDFVQNPYAAYTRARAQGPVLFWQDYGMMAAFDAATVQALLRGVVGLLLMATKRILKECVRP